MADNTFVSSNERAEIKEAAGLTDKSSAKAFDEVYQTMRETSSKQADAKTDHKTTELTFDNIYPQDSVHATTKGSDIQHPSANTNSLQAFDRPAPRQYKN